MKKVTEHGKKRQKHAERFLERFLWDLGQQKLGCMPN